MKFKPNDKVKIIDIPINSGWKLGNIARVIGKKEWSKYWRQKTINKGYIGIWDSSDLRPFQIPISYVELFDPNAPINWKKRYEVEEND